MIGRRVHRRLTAVTLSVCAIATAPGVMATTLMAQSPTMTAEPVALRARAVRGDATRDAEAPGWHLEQCIAGLTYGAPLKLAVSYGGGLLHESLEKPDVCVLGVAKLGLGGAQISAGIGSSMAPWGSGAMLTANLLRTFGSPLTATPRRTYAGASLHLWPVFALGGEIGYYVRLGDDAGAPRNGRHLVGWSAGFGF